MASSFLLTLDTAPPAEPRITIDGGASSTGQVEVLLTVTTADFGGGAHDVKSMRIWGDVDPGVDPSVQAAESDSAWQPYRELTVVRLSPGVGRKTVKCRLVDDVCNETVEFCAFIDFDNTIPVVSITGAVDRSRISKVSPCDVASFRWECSTAFVAYEVRVVPSLGSAHTAGVRVPSAAGSTGTQGVGAFASGSPILTSIHGADLEAASPGDGPKQVKVFVRDAQGIWSS